MEAKGTDGKFTFLQLLQVFWVTFRIGLVTFGGGLAMIPIIQSEFSERRGWVSDDDISDITALAQTLPGMVALNSSILVGVRMGGALVGVVAGLGCILPSFLILCVVTIFYNSFITNPWVLGALRGVSGAVVALFVSALAKLLKKNVSDWFGAVLCILAIVLSYMLPNVNIIYYILAGGLLGFIYYSLIIKTGGRRNG